MLHKPKPIGQSLLEFALVIPLFILLVTVFIDLGRAISLYAQLSNGVREGTRYAVVHQSGTTAEQDEIKAVINHYLTGMVPASVTITPPTTANHSVKIVAVYNYKPVTPGLILILGSNTIPLRVTSNATVAPVVKLTPVP
jgi:Flp pilus assembly protein TadG